MKGIINYRIQSEKAYDAYTAWLQSKGEVWRVVNEVFMMTSYQNVKAALSDEVLFAPTHIERRIQNSVARADDVPLTTTVQFLKNWLVWLRGEEHSLWKKNLLQNFHSVNDLEKIVTESATEAIDHFFAGTASSREIVSELVDPFISKVILGTLNYDERYQIDVRAWSRQIRQLLDPVFSGNTVQEAYLGLTGMAESMEKGDLLGTNFMDKTFEELDLKDRNFLYGNLQFFILAGIESSIYFFARAILVLIETGRYTTIDWDNPREVKSVAEELLRYLSPAVFLQRELTQTHTIGTVTLPKGSLVFLNVNSANRDPSVFDNPFTVDFTRTPNHHIAFGYKKHVCFGQALSRLEITTFLPLFFRQLQRYTTVEVLDLEYEKASALRGLKTFRLKLCP